MASSGLQCLEISVVPSHHSVCVVSFHPLTFPTVRGLLPEQDFLLTDWRTEFAPGEGERAIPNASVYVVEACDQLISTRTAIERIFARFPDAPLLVIGEKFDEANAFPLVRLRVKGLVTYAEAPAQLARAVQAVSGGGFWLPRALLSRFVEATVSSGKRALMPPADANLTQRERQVLEAVLENLSNKEIAHKLGITERGVKFHVSNLLSKYQVRRRADLVLLFLAPS